MFVYILLYAILPLVAWFLIVGWSALRDEESAQKGKKFAPTDNYTWEFPNGMSGNLVLKKTNKK